MERLEQISAILNEGCNLFLSGGAGVGKTTLTYELIKAFESEGRKVARLASTGMAATHIGGQTLHSFLDLGIASSMEELERRGKTEPSKKVRRLIGAMDLIVIDEISMVSADLLDMIRLRLLQAEFSGTLLVVGDFLQLPPVVRGYGEVRFAFESQSWQRFDFYPVVLSTIYRTDDTAFIELLSKVRFGMIDEAASQALDALVKPLGEDLSRHSFLFGRNDSAQRHNRAQLAHLPYDLCELHAEVRVHESRIAEQEVERFFNESRVEKVLALKVGAPVLFTRNAWNYYNGERGVVTGIDNGTVTVKKSDGYTVKLETVAVVKSRWDEKGTGKAKQAVEVPLITLWQFPLTLAFAITIHKSQGMSIEDLVIETNEIFAPSQFYVALSRATSTARLTLIRPRRSWASLAFVQPRASVFMQALSDQSAESAIPPPSSRQ